MKTLLVLLLIAAPVYAGPPKPMPQPQQQAQGQAQGQLQGQAQQVVVNTGGAETNGAELTANPTINADPSMAVGDVKTTIGGDTVENNSQFFAFGTTFPNSQGCFAGAQGGGSGSGGAGFLGFHYLDHNCWVEQLASNQRNVGVRARLQCSGSKFRKAISYDQPAKERQRYCINFMTDTYNKEIAEIQSYVDDAVATGLLAVKSECDEKVERCEAEVTLK